MTRCKSKSLPYKNMNEYLHQKGCRNACTFIIAQQFILFTKDWTIQKSTFYGISFPASPNLEGPSTHVVWLRASPSVHSCTKSWLWIAYKSQKIIWYKVRTMLSFIRHWAIFNALTYESQLRRCTLQKESPSLIRMLKHTVQNLVVFRAQFMCETLFSPPLKMI